MENNMATAPTARKTRKPLTDGFSDRISIRGKDPAYEYYIATDRPGRVDRLEEAGWEKVTDKETTVGTSRIGLPTQEGTVRTIALGGGEVGVLMKIKKEWYDEDREAKAKKAKDTITQIQKDTEGSDRYGSIKVDQRDT
jgi:hypothetical protein